MKHAIGILSLFVFVCSVCFAEVDKSRLAYIEAVKVSQQQNISPAELQRELVLLKLQSRLTPHWVEPYVRLCDLYSQLGMHRRALKIARKLAVMKRADAGIQLRLIDMESQDYQSVETLRNYLQNKLKDSSLLPEVKSSLYCQLGELSYEMFDNRRAIRYLQLALKSAPQNLKASELLKRIVTEDSKSDISEKYAQQVRDLLARIRANSFDGDSAIGLAILAGKIGDYEIMSKWRDYAEKVRNQFAAKQAWPEETLLGLAESYLITKHSDEAIKILKQIRNKRIQAEILLALAYKQKGDIKSYNTQIDEIAGEIDRKDISEHELATIAIFFSVYVDNKISVALQALKKIDPKHSEPLADIARALIFAETKQTSAAREIARKLTNTDNAFVRLIQIRCAMTEGDKKRAALLLERVLGELPGGAIRDVYIGLAKRVQLERFPSPNFSKASDLLKHFDYGYTELINSRDSMCKLELKINGKLEDGDVAILNVILTNVSPIALTIGPDCIINPALEIRVQSKKVGGRLLFLGYASLTERQILQPNASIQTNVLLEETLPLDGKIVSSWDDFIANHEDSVTHVIVEARLVSSALISGQAITINPIHSRTVNVFLPEICRHSVTVFINKLNREIIKSNVYGKGRKAYWALKSNKITEIRGKLVKAILSQIARKDISADTQVAFSWALRAYRPTGDILNVLGKLLMSRNRVVRFWAMDTIGQLQGRQARPIFEHYALRDTDASVRQLATAYLLE